MNIDTAEAAIDAYCEGRQLNQRIPSALRADYFDASREDRPAIASDIVGLIKLYVQDMTGASLNHDLVVSDALNRAIRTRLDAEIEG